MELTINNFKAIDKKTYNLEQKIYLIQGKSGCGKSTILEAIKFVLFSTSRNIKPLEGKKKTSVSLKYKNLTITRSKNPEYLILIKENKEYINQEAQKIINDNFYSENIWYLSSYIPQNKRNILLENSSQEKLQILKELIFKENKDDNQKILEMLENLSKALHDKIKKNDGIIEYLENDIKKQKNINIDFIEIYQKAKNIKDIDGKIKELEKKLLIFSKIIELKQKNISIEKLKIELKSKYPKNLNLGFLEKWKEYLIYQEDFKDLVIKDYNIAKLKEELYNSKNNQKILKIYKNQNIQKLIKTIKSKIEFLQNQKKIQKIEKLENYQLQLNDSKRQLEEKWKILLTNINHDYFVFNESNSKKIIDNYLVKKRKCYKCPQCNIKLYLENDNLEINKYTISNIDRNNYLDIIKKYQTLIEYQKETQNKIKFLNQQIPDNLKDIEINLEGDLEEHLKILYSYKEDIRNQEFIEKDIKNYQINQKYHKLKDFVKFPYPLPKDFDLYYQRYLFIQKILEENKEINLDDNIEEDIDKKLEKYKLFKEAILRCSEIETKEEDLKKEQKLRKISLQNLENINKLNKIIRETENHFMELRIGEINKQLNEILDMLFEDINIEISMFREKKGKEKNKPQVNFKIILNGIEYPNFHFFSGGEKDRISIALTLTFNIILDSPIIMFDEVFSSLEESKREESLKIIRKYSKNKILLNICHETIEGYYDQIIKI